MKKLVKLAEIAIKLLKLMQKCHSYTFIGCNVEYLLIFLKFHRIHLIVTAISVRDFLTSFPSLRAPDWWCGVVAGVVAGASLHSQFPKAR